jgi:prepilin peptidase CpaA
MSPLNEAGTALVIVYVTMVALIDLHTHRIPNELSATAAVLGLIAQASLSGAPGLLSALAGAAIVLAIFLPFYLLRAIGAGDVKAMATVGIFLGVQATPLAAAFTLIAGSIVGVVVLLRRSSTTAAAGTRRFAYGGAIAAGTFATLMAPAALQLQF